LKDLFVGGKTVKCTLNKKDWGGGENFFTETL
jgi:hypothetical protein